MTRGQPKMQEKTIRISDIIIPKFWDSFNDTSHAHKIHSSGRAGTKSSEMAIEAVFMVVQDIPQSVAVIRKRHNKLRKTVYNEIKRAIPRLGLSSKDFTMTVSPMEITYTPTGNTIYFAGSDDPDDTKGIIDKSGRPFCRCYVDEVSDFFLHGNDGEAELQNIEATFVRGNSNGRFQMVYCYNPPKNPNAPVNVWAEKMSQRDDVLRVHTTYKDVPINWIGEALVKSAEALRQADPKQYDWLWLGIPVGIDDLIYYMFSRSRHVSLPPRPEYVICYIGVDYGQMNATTYQAFGLNTARHSLDGLSEYYHSGRDSRQRSPSDYGRDMVGFIRDIRRTYKCLYFFLYIDPSAKGLAEEIKREAAAAGLQVRIRDADNAVALGISRVQKLFTFDRLSLSPGQKHATKEAGLYEYDQKSLVRGQEKPVKENDHCMDAIRYAVMGAWSKLKSYLPKGDEKEE